MSDSPDHPTGLSRDPGSSGDAEARLSALWRQGQEPDLNEFLAEAGLLSAAELTDVLCTDQRQRWLHGQRPEIEPYLALHCSFHPGAEPAIDLVFGEFMVRRQLGESPTLDEYCRRFPKLAGQLRVHVELDAMFPPGGESSLRDHAVLPRIPGYEVEAVLGQGGVGVVFRARHLRLGRSVAIKMLLAGPYAGPTELMRFELEAEAVAGLCHPNVVQMYEIGEHEGRPYFTMEFVDGGSLAQKLAAAPVANTGGSQHARWAAQMVATLAEAVSVAHRSGIIHRDLKPGNILLTADGMPKISDFGLARRLKGEGGLTWTGTAVGTPSYMSPEQASDTAVPVGPATDVYALGAVLYELLTGRPPFHAGTALETLQQVLSQEPVPPSRSHPRVPRDLETVCLKCLRKDPGRRYTSAAALAEDLGRFLAGKPIQARSVGVAEHAVKWARRRPAAALLLGALVVMAASAAGIGFRMRHQEGQAREAFMTALDRADDRRREERWPEALLILAEAESHVADANSPQLEERLRRAQADARSAAALQDVRESYPLRIDGEVDYRQRAAEYQEAFARAGLRIGDDPTTLAAFISASAIRDQLIAAAEDRALVAFMLEDDPLLGQLLQIARSVDPEPNWRDRFRQVAAWRDREQLLQLAAKAFNTSPAPPAYQLALLGCLLRRSGAESTGIQLLAEACRRQPGNFWLNRELGTTLVKAGQTTEAAGYYRAALALRPGNAAVHELLGTALFQAGQTDEALVAFRRALELLGHSRSSGQRLVRALAQAGRWAEAATACRKSLDVDPADHFSPLFLGMILFVHQRYEDAIAASRLAIGADPNAATGYYYLGLALMRQGRHDKAITAFRKVTKLRPNHGHARHLLAQELAACGRPAEAITEIRTGIARGAPDDGRYRALGALLRKQGQAEEAAAAFRKAADLLPLHPEAWDGLAAALLDRGRFAEARAAMERLLKLPATEAKRRAQQRQLGLCDALLPVEASLPAILAGKGRPESASARLALAEWCLKYKRIPATAASFYETSLAAKPALADDLETGHRFHAACAAALAGCGVSEDATTLDHRRKEALRRQALDWLTAEYSAWAERHRLGKPGNRTTAATTVRGWLRSEDLACVRDQQALTKLSPEERRAWQSLWAKAAALAARDPAAKFGQARTHVARTEWKKAARCYAEGMELEPTDEGDLWFEYAAVQLLSGDRAGYRRACARLLARCQPNGPMRPYLVARACTLAADSADDPEFLGRISQNELAQSPTAFWSLTEQAALQIRGAQIQNAVFLQNNPVLPLGQSLAADGRPGRAVLNWLWLALAHHQHGNTAEARLWLGKATQWLDQQGDQMPLDTRDLGLHPHAWLEAHVLRKEAAALLAVAN